MGYAQFLAWVTTMGWRVLGKQKYLNKVWKEATKGGKVILQTHFPKLLNKAKDYYKGFKTADLKIAPKTKIAPKKLPLPKEYVIKNLEKGLPNWKFKKVPPSQKGKVIKFPKPFKKPPTLKADGGSVDKALPKKSRDI